MNSRYSDNPAQIVIRNFQTTRLRTPFEFNAAVLIHRPRGCKTPILFVWVDGNARHCLAESKVSAFPIFTAIDAPEPRLPLLIPVKTASDWQFTRNFNFNQ
jgi:hypothetical protein